ncbi:hypothetical protein [Streptomyces aureocirculatus]|nr:hypothetical protein [Streptomyces aureocirculatus]
MSIAPGYCRGPASPPAPPGVEGGLGGTADPLNLEPYFTRKSLNG